MPIEFGIALDFGTAGDFIADRFEDNVALIQLAEQYGFTSIWVGENYAQGPSTPRDDEAAPRLAGIRPPPDPARGVIGAEVETIGQDPPGDAWQDRADFLVVRAHEAEALGGDAVQEGGERVLDGLEAGVMVEVLAVDRGDHAPTGLARRQSPRRSHVSEAQHPDARCSREHELLRLSQLSP